MLACGICTTSTFIPVLSEADVTSNCGYNSSMDPSQRRAAVVAIATKAVTGTARMQGTRFLFAHKVGGMTCKEDVVFQSTRQYRLWFMLKGTFYNKI